MSNSFEFEGETSNSAGVNTFWDLKQYVKTIRRLENANKLCTDICNMIQDRVEIEKSYSSSLHKWSTKWTSYLESGIEYGSTKQCWLGFCREAEEISDLHKDMRTRLIDDIQTDVRNWQREHFHKSTLPPQNLKEAKSLESEFDIAQKPWAKKLKKMNQCKKEYHQQCKMVRSYDVQNKNAVNDTSISQEQLKKMEEKLRKSEKDSEKLKNLYDSSLNELNGDCNRYVEEMTKVFITSNLAPDDVYQILIYKGLTYVFNKSQAMEKERMAFFKSMFSRIQKILNLSENKNLTDIYQNFENTIQTLDPDSDIAQWSQLYGADFPFSTPQFEEYTQELHSISKKKLNLTNDSGVTLTAVNMNSRQASIRSGDTGRDSMGKSMASPSTGTEASTPSFNMETSSPLSTSALRRLEPDLEDSAPPMKPCRSISSNKSVTRNDHRQNSISAETETPIKESPVFSDEDYVQVRALYDYIGVEEDELTLKQGDLFYKLEDEDEQGWCKGKKDGRVGLYPANYAEIV